MKIYTFVAYILVFFFLVSCSQISKIPISPGVGEQWKDPYSGIEFVWIPGGNFVMGCNLGTNECDEAELPVHEVNISGYWLGKNEITIGQFKKFLKDLANNVGTEQHQINLKMEGKVTQRHGFFWLDHSEYDKENSIFTQHPVANVSWQGAKAFASWLQDQTKHGFRLPTEAEWEYACRGGARNHEFGTNTGKWSDQIASYSSGDNFYHAVKSYPVGSFPSNVFGINDMTGNVWELCEDMFDSEYYQTSSKINPLNSDEGEKRVVRGGAYNSVFAGLSCSVRHKQSPDYLSSNVGFRLVLVHEVDN